ncbi:MAG: aldehyde dehydrogenase family protein [Acidobacteriaceae bacterium]
MGILETYATMEYGPALEDAKEALLWLDQHGRKFKHFIGGAWQQPAAREFFETTDPSTGEVLATVAQGDAADIDAAVRAARAALGPWQSLTPHKRAGYLYAMARQVQKHSRRLAVLETMDNGKSIRESRDIDVPLVARHFYHHAGWAQLLEQEFPGHSACGVVGQIIPWNFPLLMLAWKIAPALSAGNTAVLKPAEYTPLTALAFAEICQAIGLPAGVVNIVTGDGRTGEALVAHPDVDKIAFTGSTEVGRAIRKATAATAKKLSLELGGKSPFVVFDDADLDSAVEGVVDGIWFNQGQVCCAGSRLLVQERVYESMLAKLRARMETLRVGAPLDKAVDIGAIVAPVQLARIRRMVDQGVQDGAVCWQSTAPLPERGLYFPPTLLTNVHPSSMVVQEEIFGPVLVTMSFRTLSEAVELANNTTYGLAASVWSESINVALDVAARLKAGVVWVNGANFFDAACGFGGYRESGFGREGGREGMYEYLTPTWLKNAPMLASVTVSVAGEPDAGETERDAESFAGAGLDRTVKQYIGGKQARPDSGYSMPIYAANGSLIGEAPLGNRKDIRNAVEAASNAASWAKTTAHNRAQVLFYMAENLSHRHTEIAQALARVVGEEQAEKETAIAVERIFSYAAWADKFEGAVHTPPMRNVTLAMHEPVGIVGIVCPPDAPLLALLSLGLPAIAMGNTVVAIPSEKYPLIVGDLYQLFDTGDLPGGVVNLVAGRSAELSKVLAEHDNVDALWYFGDAQGGARVKAASIGNLKQTWTNEGRAIDWFDPHQAEGRMFLRHATQVKNVWVPYGE